MSSVKLKTPSSGSVTLTPQDTANNVVVTVPNTDGTLLTSSTDGASVISANSSSAALRITQTGAGNALLVEDSANPDATPFVVDANGRVITGHTASVPTGVNYQFQSYSANPFVGVRWNSSNTGPTVAIGKSRSDTVGTLASVANGDTVGNLDFMGDDGTAFLTAARILAQVDGTPGTNDMPGRLVFSTTADGASTPTERMRIRSDGNVAIGGVGAASVELYLQSPITGNAGSAYGLFIQPTVQPDVTGNAYASRTNVSIASGAAVTNLVHHEAAQSTFTGTATTQYGFVASSSLIGATNNFGFYSSIASGTGRWNFYATGTAPNYFAGQTLLGNTTAINIGVSDSKLQVIGTGASDASIGIGRFRNDGGGASIIAFKGRGAAGSFTTVNSGDTLFGINIYGADGTAAVQAASITAAVDGTPGTNDMPGRLVFSTTADGAATPTEVCRMTADNRLVMASSAGLTIGRTAVTAPAATDGNVFSGTYTPTLTNQTNVAASTAYACQYMRVGNVVTVSGKVDVTATAGSSTITELRISVPVASSFASSHQAGGAASDNISQNGAIYAVGLGSTARLVFPALLTTSRSFYFSFTYQVV